MSTDQFGNINQTPSNISQASYAELIYTTEVSGKAIQPENITVESSLSSLAYKKRRSVSQHISGETEQIVAAPQHQISYKKTIESVNNTQSFKSQRLANELDTILKSTSIASCATTIADSMTDCIAGPCKFDIVLLPSVRFPAADEKYIYDNMLIGLGQLLTNIESLTTDYRASLVRLTGSYDITVPLGSACGANTRTSVLDGFNQVFVDSEYPVGVPEPVYYNTIAALRAIIRGDCGAFRTNANKVIIVILNSISYLNGASAADITRDANMHQIALDAASCGIKIIAVNYANRDYGFNFNPFATAALRDPAITDNGGLYVESLYLDTLPQLLTPFFQDNCSTTSIESNTCPNKLINGTFDSGLTGWTVLNNCGSPPSNFFRYSPSGHNGGPCANIQGCTVKQTVNNLTPGDTVTLTWSTRNGNDLVAYIDDVSKQSYQSSDHNSWFYASANDDINVFTSVVGASGTVTVMFNGCTSTDTLGIFFDDVVLCTSTPTAVSNDCGEGSSNLISNPYFDEDVTGWTDNNGVQLSPVTDPKYWDSTNKELLLGTSSGANPTFDGSNSIQSVYIIANNPIGNAPDVKSTFSIFYSGTVTGGSFTVTIGGFTSDPILYDDYLYVIARKVAVVLAQACVGIFGFDPGPYCLSAFAAQYFSSLYSRIVDGLPVTLLFSQDLAITDYDFNPIISVDSSGLVGGTCSISNYKGLGHYLVPFPDSSSTIQMKFNGYTSSFSPTATVAEITTALENNPSIGQGNVLIHDDRRRPHNAGQTAYTWGLWSIEFINALAGKDLPLFESIILFPVSYDAINHIIQGGFGSLTGNKVTLAQTAIEGVSPGQSMILSFNFDNVPNTSGDLELIYELVDDTSGLAFFSASVFNRDYSSFPAKVVKPFIVPSTVNDTIYIRFKTGTTTGIIHIDNVLCCVVSNLCDQDQTKLSFDDFSTSRGGWIGGILENHALTLIPGNNLVKQTYIDLPPNSIVSIRFNMLLSGAIRVEFTSGASIKQYFTSTIPGIKTFSAVVQSTGLMTISLAFSDNSTISVDDILVCYSSSIVCDGYITDVKASIEWDGIPRNLVNVFGIIARFKFRDISNPTITTTSYALPIAEGRLGTVVPVNCGGLTTCDFWKQNGNKGTAESVITAGNFKLVTTQTGDSSYVSLTPYKNWFWSIPASSIGTQQDRLIAQWEDPPQKFVDSVDFLIVANKIIPDSSITGSEVLGMTSASQFAGYSQFYGNLVTTSGFTSLIDEPYASSDYNSTYIYNIDDRAGCVIAFDSPSDMVSPYTKIRVKLKVCEIPPHGYPFPPGTPVYKSSEFLVLLYAVSVPNQVSGVQTTAFLSAYSFTFNHALTPINTNIDQGDVWRDIIIEWNGYYNEIINSIEVRIVTGPPRSHGTPLAYNTAVFTDYLYGRCVSGPLVYSVPTRRPGTTDPIVGGQVWYALTYSDGQFVDTPIYGMVAYGDGLFTNNEGDLFPPELLPEDDPAYGYFAHFKLSTIECELTGKISEPVPPTCDATFLKSPDPATTFDLIFNYKNSRGVAREFRSTVNLNKIRTEQSGYFPDPPNAWDTISALGYGIYGFNYSTIEVPFGLDVTNGSGLDQCTSPLSGGANGDGVLTFPVFKMSGIAYNTGGCEADIVITKSVEGSSTNEVQSIVLPDPRSGFWTLTVTINNNSQTATLPWNSTSALIASRLAELSNIGNSNNVAVTGSGSTADPFLITFTGSLAAVTIPLMVADGTRLVGSASGHVESVVVGTKDEQQTITANSTGSTPFQVTFSGSTSSSIAANASLNTVQQKLSEMSSIGPGNILVTGTISDRTALYRGPWHVRFINALGAQNVPMMTVTSGYRATLDWQGLTGTNDQQKIVINASGGLYSITLTNPNVTGQSATTSLLAYNADSDTIYSAIITVATWLDQDGDVSVTQTSTNVTGQIEFERTVTFGGRYAGLPMPLMTLDTLLLTGGSILVDEVSTGDGVGDQQLITLYRANNGYYKLSVTIDGVSAVSGPLKWNNSSEDVQNSLADLPFFTRANDVLVSNGRYNSNPDVTATFLVRFNKRFGNVALMQPENHLICIPFFHGVEPPSYPYAPEQCSDENLFCSPLTNLCQQEQINLFDEVDDCCSSSTVKDSANVYKQVVLQRDLFDPYQLTSAGNKLTIRDIAVLKGLKPSDYNPYIRNFANNNLVLANYSMVVDYKMSIVLIGVDIDSPATRNRLKNKISSNEILPKRVVFG